MAGALPSDTVKNPKLNVNSTYLILSAQEEKQEKKDNPENINTNPSPLPDLSVSFITEKVCKLNSFFKSLGLVPQSSNTEIVCTKGDDNDIMFIEIIKQDDDSHIEEPEVDFMIVEDISSIIDPRLSQVVLEKPFVEISNMTHDPPEALGWHLEEIHVTWAHLEKKRTRLRLYTKIMKNCAYTEWRRVAIIKRRRQDLHRDDVRDPTTTSGRGRLKEDLESSTWRRRHNFKAMPYVYGPKRTKAPRRVYKGGNADWFDDVDADGFFMIEVSGTHESDGLESGNVGLGTHKSDGLESGTHESDGIENDNVEEFDPRFSYPNTNYQMGQSSEPITSPHIKTDDVGVDIQGSDNNEESDDSEESEDNADIDFEYDIEDMIDDVHVDMEMGLVPVFSNIGPSGDSGSNVDGLVDGPSGSQSKASGLDYKKKKIKKGEKAIGDHTTQYAQLRQYVLELKERNQVTTVKIDVERNYEPDSETRKFRRIYVCLGALKSGFKAWQRYLLGLDVCFMSGAFPMQILTSVGVGPNNGTYLLAYAIIKSENKQSWLWFLDCLGDDLELFKNSNFTFVIDRKKRIIPALAETFPCVEHRYCLKYIYDNMKLQWKGKLFKELLWRCVTATTMSHFNRNIEELKSENKMLMIVIGWKGQTYHYMLRVYKRISYEKDYDSPTDGPHKDQCVVNVEERTCSCRKLDLTWMPCKHAVVAIWNMVDIGLEHDIPETWVHPNNPIILTPSDKHTPIGRPPKKRKKSAAELCDGMVKDVYSNLSQTTVNPSAPVVNVTPSAQSNVTPSAPAIRLENKAGTSMANPKLNVKDAKIILGSSSMARKEILKEMGYDFTIMTADIDEKSIRKEKPEDLVLALAEAKHIRVGVAVAEVDDFHIPELNLFPNHQADAIISRFGIAGHKEENAHPTLLITADTVVVYEGTIREKPSSKEEARHFVKGYSGGCAIVVGSVVVTNLTTGIKKRGWDRSEVYFHDIPDEIIDKLVDDGVTLNVAGGLMLEHPLTAPFVDTVIGTADGVMGLSKSLTEKLLKESLESS
ncbi:mutator type transposase [Tanacetum coccineum]|uniref:Mutator type transposase n=1 Tax=Tanacetum coccineum TaxID=301880 RepID=A0ABQ5E048_9ASTR